MIIFVSILLLIVGFLLIDIFLIGFIPSLLGIYPSYLKIKRDILIEDRSFEYGVDTNLFPFYKVILKSILITKKRLYVRHTYLACARTIRIDQICGFQISNPILFSGRRVKLLIKEENEIKYFSFRTKIPNEWVKVLHEVGIHQI